MPKKKAGEDRVGIMSQRRYEYIQRFLRVAGQPM